VFGIGLKELVLQFAPVVVCHISVAVILHARPERALLQLSAEFLSVKVASVTVFIAVVQPAELGLAIGRRMHHEARFQRHELSLFIALVDPHE
jgi:hypothetical protein